MPRELWITTGDRDGIGVEVTLKGLLRLKLERQVHSLKIVGGLPRGKSLKSVLPLFRHFARSPLSKKCVWILPPKGVSGFEAGWSIQTATEGVLASLSAGRASALVTGPIDKDRLRAGGYPFDGHTEFLQHLTRSPSVTMMLANQKMRVSLATTHLALEKVSKTLEREPERLDRTVQNTIAFLKEKCGISTPKIAVCGLNPHCGENGHFGSEEQDFLIPQIQALETRYRRKALIKGAFSADTLFAKEALERKWDAIIALYHDQGLIPVKLLDFDRTVNVTLNLPMIRTSVDHGVAFDIAGKSIARPESMISAIELALELLNKDSKDKKGGPTKRRRK